MSNRQRYLLPFLMLLLLFCGTGLCAAVDTSVTVIDTLVVRAARTGAMPLRSDPSTTTILNLEDLSPGVDLADVLAGVAGLQVRRYGGLGAPSLPSLRGGGAAGIVVMIDGVPVADAQTGTVDLSSLALDRFRAAEIHRGLTPAGFGSMGGVGAVNLISRDEPVSGTELSLRSGSFGDAGGRLSTTRHFTDHDASVSLLLHGRRIDNQFDFLDHNQTFLATVDDYQRERLNADFSESGAVVSGTQATRWLQLQARLGGYRREGGRPGPIGGYESPHARIDLQRVNLHLGASDIDETLHLDAYMGRNRETLDDPLAEVGADPPGETESRSDHLYLRGRKSLDFDLPRGAMFGRWESGGSWRAQRFDNRYGDLKDPTRERRTWSAFSSLSLYEPAHRLVVVPSLVWRRLEDDFPPLPALPHQPEEPLSQPHVMRNVSPTLGMSWEIWPANLLLESHWTRTLREPTWVELFGHRGGITGNRDLKPETLRSRDLVLRWIGSRAVLARLALFETRAEDAIVWRRNSQLTSTAVNAGETRTRGVELELFSRGAGALRWWANLTWQHARDRGLQYSGNRLPYLSDLEAALGAALTRGRWEAGLRMMHESASYRDRYNTPQDEVPSRTVWNLSMGVNPGPLAGFSRSNLTVEIVNLTDDRIYDVEGFPLPGRSLQLAFSLQ
jgi:iron complex outermembrane recepter protein